MSIKKKIFIVEDESIIALTIESTLQSLGFEVIGYVPSSEECMEFLQTQTPDLILMDIRLNGKVNGIDTAKKIKKKYNIPVIFLTAYSTPELIDKAKEANPYGYIVKPFRPRDLWTSIELALNKHEYETKLVASENKYRKLVETINEGILQISITDNKIQYVNSTFCEMLELSYEKIIDKDAAEVLYFVNDQKDLFIDLKNRRTAGISEKYELRLVTKSGREKCFLISGTPVNNENNEAIASLSVWLDISDKKNQLNQLKKFYNTIEQSKELIIITDKSGVVEYINSTFCKVTGYAKDELIGKTPKVLKSGAHDKSFYENLWNLITAGESFTGEFINRKKNGDLYYEEKIITPLVNENDEIVNYISTGRDITEKIITQKKIEAYKNLQAYNEKRQVRIRTHSLIQGQEEERQRISRDLHDGLGQILTAAKINLERINIKELVKKSKYKDLEKVYDLVIETINEVRKISYDLSPSTLHDFGLLSAVKTTISKINESQNTFKINLNTNLTTERFNKDIEINLFRIIQEAINNSIKHSKCTMIEIDLYLKGNSLKGSVSDNGIGFMIPKNISYLENNKFNNGLKNIKERSNIIDGKVEIISTPGKGVVISFNIKNKTKK